MHPPLKLREAQAAAVRPVLTPRLTAPGTKQQHAVGGGSVGENKLGARHPNSTKRSLYSAITVE
ncbi:hypothetical protein [Paenibacillus sp. 1011MAR3C5]|uniref:hypothetical protein n=1 Tax=Paenibacillus sp. 1011MAR3C5 TaxID=1675787 RepID=UPI001602B3E3|nr:hypothetical protein [Paenibacillus sp. 1011MAR3C5]